MRSSHVYEMDIDASFVFALLTMSRVKGRTPLSGSACITAVIETNVEKDERKRLAREKSRFAVADELQRLIERGIGKG